MSVAPPLPYPPCRIKDSPRIRNFAGISKNLSAKNILAAAAHCTSGVLPQHASCRAGVLFAMNLQVPKADALDKDAVKKYFMIIFNCCFPQVKPEGACGVCIQVQCNRALDPVRFCML